MSLTRSDVDKIAFLARIEISEAEKDRYVHDLNGILALAEQMNAVDTGTISPMAHPLRMTQRLRPDQVTEPGQRELFQGIAPAVEEGLYLVPKVIE
ncbi:MAG: Asp-tRNA(Asn)/Glu-tRNA(Gln) amidotransferase subunit GatC [Gammaproteobacteria bacterium]|jgi:aspartyl-tRNA(Asn)/glutamyl-tRNA(Gln) amidotransferase subunit C|nr:Asp-tRNA(Asn)/Glu-tRNA(Gln) amidotransferase subunit GatC [Candidatus Thioaporhodococcus sediminis]TNF53350.1 MAG: Asp-tRNA(Asn)/Glu-tRNA(Gln) amidotransferase subunit GatC [Gammaproteobacteria bacterium]